MNVGNVKTILIAIETSTRLMEGTPNREALRICCIQVSEHLTKLISPFLRETLDTLDAEQSAVEAFVEKFLREWLALLNPNHADEFKNPIRMKIREIENVAEIFVNTLMLFANDKRIVRFLSSYIDKDVRRICAKAREACRKVLDNQNEILRLPSPKRTALRLVSST